MCDCSLPRHASPESTSLAWQFEQGHCRANGTNSVSLEIATSLTYTPNQLITTFFRPCQKYSCLSKYSLLYVYDWLCCAIFFYFRSNNDTRHCTRYAALHKPVLMSEVIQSIGNKWQDFMPKIELLMGNFTGDYLDI